MVTAITLGTVFSQADKQVLTGGQSGLDVEALVNSLADAKRLPAVAFETEIESNIQKAEAYSEMRSLLDSFRSTSDFLRNPPGVQNASENIFEYRSGSVSSNTSVDGENYLTVTAEPGTSIAEYEIEITQLATRNVQTTDTFLIADADTSIVGGTGPINVGTLTLGANATTIDLEDGDSLSQVVSKINSVSGQSGVEATAIKVADGEYRLSFKTTDTGTAVNYDLNALNPGLFNVGFAIQDNAQDSIMQFDGTAITRSSNSIDDIIDGVTFNLNQTTPVGTELEVTIEPDRELAKQGIINFVDAYNAFRLFVSQQSEVGDNGQPTEAAILAGSSTMRLSMSRIGAEMSQAIDGIIDDDPSRLSDLGITFFDFDGDEETPFTRNVLTIDEDKLDAALSSDYDAVRKVFEFDFSSNDPDLQVFSRTNGLEVSEFSLNIDQTNQIFQATYKDAGGNDVTIDLDKEDLSGSSIVLNGQDGTVLEGLTLIYANANDNVIDVNITQGISDRIFNTIENMLEEETGTIAVEIDNLESKNERLEQEITRIDELVEDYRLRLLDQYAALESAISQANTLLQTLDAQSQANNNN